MDRYGLNWTERKDLYVESPMRRSLMLGLLITPLLGSIGLVQSEPANAQIQLPDTTPDIHYDDSGLIVHRDAGGHFDGGDTSQREGWYWLGVWIRSNTPGLSPWTTPRKLSFDDVLAKLEPKQDGVFYRHPNLAPWNNPYDKALGTSRDQLVPLIAAMGVWNRAAPLQRLWQALPEDGLGKHSFNGSWQSAFGIKVFTGDLLGPQYVNLYKRSLNQSPTSRLGATRHLSYLQNASVGESELLLNTQLRVKAGQADRDDVGPDLNHIVCLIMSMLRHKTAISDLAVSRYTEMRPHSYGSFLRSYRQHYGDDETNIRGRIEDGIRNGWTPDTSAAVGIPYWYHRASVGANPALAAMYEPILTHFFS